LPPARAWAPIPAMRFKALPATLGACVMAGALAVMAAYGRSWPGLVENSPFVGKGKATDTPPPENQQLELRGVLRENGAYFFSVYDTASKKETWVRQGDPGDPFKVRDYDAFRETATMEARGQMVSLVLRKSQIQATDHPSSSVVASLARPTAPSAPVKTQVQASSEVARLELVAKEIQQRREQRRKISTQTESSKT